MSLLHPDVSVIMPVYNGEENLHRALTTIQNQTLESMEIILVDDGSTDRTAQMLAAAQSRDLRIQVFHTEHKGKAHARNLGLEKARGTYVYFADTDDWSEPTMLFDMYRFAHEHDLSLVITSLFIDVCYRQGDHGVTELKSCETQVMSDQQQFRDEAWKLFDQGLFFGVWNKLYLRSYLLDNHIGFTDSRFGDFDFSLKVVSDVQRVGSLNKAYYHFTLSAAGDDYRRWEPGLYEQRLAEHEQLCQMYRDWGSYSDEQVQYMINKWFLRSLVACIEDLCDPRCVLSADEKLEIIATMITSEQARKASEMVKPQSRMMQMMLTPIKNQNVSLVYSEGRFISFVKRRNSRMFSPLRRI